MATTNARTFTAGSGYKVEDFVPAEPNTKLITEDQIQSIAGTASASAMLSGSDTWGAVLGAFKAAVSGGAARPQITAISPTSGPVGSSVTITGTNFGSNSRQRYDHVQRGGGNTNELECDEHCSAGAERGDNGKCGRDGRRCSQ